MVTSASGSPLGRMLIDLGHLGRTENRPLRGTMSDDVAWEAGRESCFTGQEERWTDSLTGWDSPILEPRMRPATLPAASKSSPLAQETFFFYA